MRVNPTLHSDELSGRIPYRMRIGTDGSLKFSWLYVGDTKFTEPFFEGTLVSALSAPENSGVLPLTSADEVIQRASREEMRNPCAIIFHASRCGSTLLAQMLATHDGFTVLAEVPLLDAILHLNPEEHRMSEQHIQRLFHSTVNLIAQRQGTGSNIVIKADSWHVLSYSRLRAWFPEAPFFLMHRKTSEIAASHLQKPGMHAVAGVLPASLFGMSQEEASAMSRDDYFGTVLVNYYNAYDMIVTHDANASLLDYHKGPERMLEQFLQKCEIPLGQDVIDKMKRRASFHSKDPLKFFSGDAYSPAQLNEVLETAEQLRTRMIARVAVKSTEI